MQDNPKPSTCIASIGEGILDLFGVTVNISKIVITHGQCGGTMDLDICIFKANVHVAVQRKALVLWEIRIVSDEVGEGGCKCSPELLIRREGWLEQYA